MDDFSALSRALRAEQPAIPEDLLAAQRRRLFRDPRARVARPVPALSLALAFSLCALVASVFVFWSGRPAAGVSSGGTPTLAAVGAPLEHALDAGTRVRLEPGARGSFAPREPKVARFELERGRATFDVTRSEARSFRVVAGRNEVRVLGTRFSVVYEPLGRFAVEVERGLVSVALPGRESILLAAGERLDATASNVAIQRAKQAPPGADLPGSAPAPTPSAAPVPSLSAGERRSDADWRDLYLRRNYPAALQAARRAGIERLAAELGPAELADLADAARLGGDAPLALSLLRGLERRFPGTKQGGEASFLIGRLLLQGGKRGEAGVAFERYLRTNADGVYTSETLGRLMELYAERGDTSRARAMAERYLARAPQGPYQRLARSLIAQP